MASSSERIRWIAVVPAAILVVAGLASFLLQTVVFAPDATDSDWKSASEYVLDHKEPDDGIRVHPAWNETPYPYLTEAKLDFSRQNEPVAEDLKDFDRLWLMVERDRREDALSAVPWELTNEPQTRAFGAVDLLLLERPDYPRYEYDLLEHLEDAEITREREGKPIITCERWNSKKRHWYCERPDPWIFVGATWRSMNDDPRQCIWAHPPPNHYWVELTYRDVPMSDVFRARAGPTASAVRSSRGTPIEFEVQIGDVTKRHLFPAKAQAWKAFDVDTSQWAGEKKTVHLRARSVNVFDRFFCLNGWVLDRGDG